MTDDAELTGLDPFDLLDREATRIDAYLSTLAPDEWSRPSRCAGWSIRDVLAHLRDGEHYHRACLDGKVPAFLSELESRGATDLAAINALGIADLAERTPAQLLAEWRESNAETRRRFRERDDGIVDTSVGNYPCRWQAFHVAGELATHADDMFIPVSREERDERRSWRSRFSRFALAELKPQLEIQVEEGRTRVRGDGLDVELDDGELIESVAGRLEPSERFSPAMLALLSTMP